MTIPQDPVQQAFFIPLIKINYVFLFTQTACLHFFLVFISFFFLTVNLLVSYSCL